MLGANQKSVGMANVIYILSEQEPPHAATDSRTLLLGGRVRTRASIPVVF